MEEDKNEAVEQVEQEIAELRKADSEEPLEIEIVEEPDQKTEPEVTPEQEADYGEKVQRRIKKLVDQRRAAELQARKNQEETEQLKARLERLEKGTATQAHTQAQNAFQNRYTETREALMKAFEEGDTKAQLDFTEQLTDMRATARIAELQGRQRVAQAESPTVGRAERAAVEPPTPKKAMDWWQKNRWFNSSGFERETAAARAIDVQLDLEGYDKESDHYYDQLNNRLLSVFPELSSGSEPVKSKPKSRSPVAPTAGGPTYKGNRIRLSNDQLRMARELGITDEAGLKKYEAEVRQQRRS
jgi:hypothetical protein